MLKNFEDVALISTHRYVDIRGEFSKTDVTQIIDFSIKEVFSSISKKNVLRGMHFQNDKGIWQKKVVSVLDGEILDVVVNINPKSNQYKSVQTFKLNSKSDSLYIPAHFAHGFLTLTETATVQYICNEKYSTSESGILWNSINFNWPVKSPILSERDQLHEEL